MYSCFQIIYFGSILSTHCMVMVPCYVLFKRLVVLRKRTRLILLILLFISSFFFVCNFQISKNFVTIFSRTVRSIQLKLATHIDSGLLYHVFWNQAAGAYSFLYFFIFLPLRISKHKMFATLFLGTVRPTKLKLDIRMGNGLICCV